VTGDAGGLVPLKVERGKFKAMNAGALFGGGSHGGCERKRTVPPAKLSRPPFEPRAISPSWITLEARNGPPRRARCRFGRNSTEPAKLNESARSEPPACVNDGRIHRRIASASRHPENGGPIVRGSAIWSEVLRSPRFHANGISARRTAAPGKS